MVMMFSIFLATLSQGQQDSAKEAETIVRTAYAKLSYADEVRIVLDALNDTDRKKLWTAKANMVDDALDARLDFALSEFHSGRISDIAERKISAFDGFLTQIGGEVLDVTPSIYNYAVNGSPLGYVAYVKFAWKASPYLLPSPAEDWSIAKALQDPQFEGKAYTEYVTYTVTLTFQKKSRTYKTWMLFGRDHQGKPQVYFMDSVADPTAVTFAFEHSLYPAAFIESDLRTVPFVDKWLRDNARSCHARSDKDNGRVDVCCDPENGRCGVAESTLEPLHSGTVKMKRSARVLPARLSISSLPVHPVMQSTGTDLCSSFTVGTTFAHGLGDAQEHKDGQHNFTAVVVGSCTYSDGATVPGPCNVKCSAASSSVIQEFGGLAGLLFQHATALTNSSGADFANGGTTPVSCLGVSGGTVKSCTLPCSTTVSATAGGKGNLGATISFPASQPGELHTLPEMGVFSIGLDYSLSRRIDEFGNVFRYKARINQGMNGDPEVGKKIYDVFFVTK